MAATMDYSMTRQQLRDLNQPLQDTGGNVGPAERTLSTVGGGGFGGFRPRHRRYQASANRSGLTRDVIMGDLNAYSRPSNVSRTLRANCSGENGF